MVVKKSARQFFLVLFLSSILHPPSSICFARESAGTGGAAFLTVPVAVRAMGMGDVGAAIPSGVNGAHLNPAGVTSVRKSEASFSFQDTLADTSLGFLGAAIPMSYRGVSDLGGSTLFGSLVYFNKGNIEINRLKADGSLDSSVTQNAGYDMALSLGYAEHFFKGSFGVRALEEGVHSLGFVLRGIQSTLAGGYEANAAGFDLGYMGTFRKFGVGAGAANLGAKLKFIEVGDPLPVVVRAGVSANHDFGIFRLTGALDGVHQEKAWHQRLGTEMTLPTHNIALRGGWRFESKNFQGGPALGFGFDLDTLFLDYAFTWFGDLRDTHRLLAGYRFGSTLR